MKLSSASSRYRGDSLAEHCAVSKHRPEHVNTSASQGQDRLLVVLPLSPFPVVERLRHRTPPGCHLRGEVAGPQQSAVVAFRSVMVTADATRVPGRWCQARDSGQPVRTVELVDPAAGRSSELGPQEGPEPGHRQQDFGIGMLTETVLDAVLDTGDVIGQPQDLSSESGHDHRTRVLAGHRGVLLSRGVDGDLGDSSGRPGSAFLQPRAQALCAHAADARWGLVSGEQEQGSLRRRVVERGFQAGEELAEAGPHPVDRPGPVTGQVSAVGGEQTQFGRDVVTEPDGLQVAAHPGLVGDDPGVFGIGLPVAAVGAGCVVDGAPGNVEQRLPVSVHQRDEQRGTTPVEVRRPRHRPRGIGEGVDLVDEGCDDSFGVGDLLRQKPVAVGVDDDAVMVGLAGVDAGEQVGHSGSFRRCGRVPPRVQQPRRRVLTQRSGRVSQSAVEPLWDARWPILLAHTSGG